MQVIQELSIGIDNLAIYQLGIKITVDQVSRFANEHQLQFFHICGTHISDKQSFLASISHAMDFPDYFHSNWDAFEECITDMEWQTIANGFVLLYENFENFVDCAPSQWRILLDILESSVQFWNQQKVPVYIFLKRKSC